MSNHLHPRKRTVSSSGNSPIIRAGHKAIYKNGRPPWYDAKGQITHPFLIAICGGSGSGKTTVANYIINELNVPWVSLVSMDSFYMPLTQEQREAANRNDHDFDHPSAMDFELIQTVLSRLKDGKSVQVPIYDFTTHSRLKQNTTIYGANVIIFEGIMAFESRLLPLFDLKIFVETDADERLDRRLRRDIKSRNRTIESILMQYERFVKPAYESFISPMMKYADIIIPRGGENTVALNLLIPHIERQLISRGHPMRSQLANVCPTMGPNKENVADPDCMPSNLYILPETREIKGLHTFIRNKETHRDDFVFYSDRLIRLLFEYACGLLPYKDVTVTTKEGNTYQGRRLSVRRFCAISVMRAGETMEAAVSAVFNEVHIGKILIQTNSETLEPELHYLRLPECLVSPEKGDDLDNTYVMVMDSTVASGAAAMMAIRVLLEHDVPEKNIFLVCLLMAAQGIHTLAYVFPEIKIVTTAVDKEITTDFHILPGVGNFGDRYFGTDCDSSDECMCGSDEDDLNDVTTFASCRDDSSPDEVAIVTE